MWETAFSLIETVFNNIYDSEIITQKEFKMSNNTIYDIFWEGPYKLDDINKYKSELVHDGHCLYQIYGDHPCYGRDVLLYIGKTLQGVATRMSQHNNRFSSQVEEVKVFIASCHEFTDWNHRNSIKKYGPIDSDTLDQIESLLIYAHQPAYNSDKITTLTTKHIFRIFNSGRRKSLLPEISTEFWLIKQGNDSA